MVIHEGSCLFVVGSPTSSLSTNFNQQLTAKGLRGNHFRLHGVSPICTTSQTVVVVAVVAAAVVVGVGIDTGTVAASVAGAMIWAVLTQTEGM
jgi:hypothetical protein